MANPFFDPRQMMANPFFDPRQMMANQNPMMQQFGNIQNMLKGKDPMQFLSQIASGNGYSPEQVNKARQFQAMLNQNMSPDTIAESSLKQMGFDPRQFR